MTERKLFETMDPVTAAFYSRVFNTAVLNIHAVRYGYFDILISESDDPNIMIRWRQAVPEIVRLIQVKQNGR